MRLLVIDNSEYLEFARCLGASGEFDEVGYFCPWADDTPMAQESVVGTGFDEFIREYVLWDAVPNYDAFAFPALHWAAMQRWLRNNKYPVWGSGDAELLELDRWKLIQNLKRIGMPVSPSKYVTLTEAKEIIKDGDVIKISTFRGDVETHVHDGDWGWWHELALRWGPLRDRIKVVVQKPLPEGVEPGFDLIAVKGRVCEPLSVGYEVKDHGYIEKNLRINQIPKPLRETYEGSIKLIGKDYINFMSTEVLSGHLLDITCRIPEPPGNLKFHIWKGLPRIVKHALAGTEFYDTRPQNVYGVQLIMHNNTPRNYCRFGEIDESIRPYVYFDRAFKLDNVIWTVPWRHRDVQDWIGVASICGTGKTPEVAIDEAQRILKELPCPEGCLVDPGVKEGFLKALEDGIEEGIIL